MRPVLGGARDLEVEVDLRGQAERHRVHRGQAGGVPVGAVADLLDRRLGGADEAHDLRVLQLGVVAQQPEDGVGPVLAARHRRVARPLLALLLRQLHARFGQLQAVVRVLLGLLDLLAGQLARVIGSEPLDAGRDFAVGDALHLERVKLAEVGDLLERQRCVLDEPDGCRLRHQRSLDMC